MVVKQANITSYKVSDPSEILDRRPVFRKKMQMNFKHGMNLLRTRHLQRMF